MTILVAVRTGSAAVIAADSKLTTSAPAGLNPDGSTRWLTQSYDYAVKVVHDSSLTSIAAFAGHGNIGNQQAADWFSRLSLDLEDDPPSQDDKIRKLVEAAIDIRKTTWVDLPTTNWPATNMFIAAPPRGGTAPRVWRIELQQESGVTTEILKNTGVWLDGTINEIFSLLYGYSLVHQNELPPHLGVSKDDFNKALLEANHVRPINQINFWTMPLQDAIDFAVFCAKVQVQMDRFLPGTKSCGGPIDLMTLEMAPSPKIRTFPGKSLHHPEF